MSILDVNDNFLRGTKINLRIIDGESAETYDSNLGDNFDLMNGDYWIDFIQNTDSIYIPLLKINSITKVQQIWFRNKSLLDTAEITISNDSRDNIVEFVNKGVKNADLDFNTIEQLIFIIELDYIDQTGFPRTKPFFTGRATPKYDTSSLTLTLKGLTDRLRTSKFETNVLEYPTASFFNFVSLKQAFKNIINAPHNLDDEYAYPISPFRVNEDTYVPFDGYTLIEQELTIGQEFEVYAEDKGVTDNEEDIFFYYKDSPECGIITREYNEDGSFNQQSVFRTSNMNIFENGDNAPTWMKTFFRFLRPVKRYKSTYEDSNLSTFNYVEFGSFLQRTLTPDDKKIRVGDDIIIFEACGDFFNNATGTDYAILFNSTCNVFIYNQTRDIFYANAIAYNVSTIPLPKQFLAMDGYSGLVLRYDNHFPYNPIENEGVNFNAYFSFSTPMLYIDSSGSPYPTINATIEALNDQTKEAFVKTFNVGWINNSTPIYPESNYQTIADRLDTITDKFKPKTVRLSSDKTKIYHVKSQNRNYKRGEYDEDDSNTDLYNGDNYLYATDLKRTQPLTTTKNYAYTAGQIKFKTSSLASINFFECTPFLEDNSCIAFGDFSTTAIETPYVNTSNGLNVAFIYASQPPSVNFDDAGDVTYWFYDNIVYNSILSSPGYETYKTYDTNIKILDINTDLDRIILLDKTLSQLEYRVYSTDEIIEVKSSVSGLDYLFSYYRDSLRFTNTLENDIYYEITTIEPAPVRLLSFSGNRLQACVGLCNSFIKNAYQDENGILNIGILDTTNTITLTDDTDTKISQVSSRFGVLEYNKYDKSSNTLTENDNDDAITKTQDDEEYDSSVTIAISSDIDIDILVRITRNASDYTYYVSNDFDSDTGTFTPPNDNTFPIALGGIFTGITLTVNFFDTELEVGKTFQGRINRRELIESATPNLIKGTAVKKVWQDASELALKFPFLYKKYQSEFQTKMDSYFKYGSAIRPFLEYTVEVAGLIIWDENYNMIQQNQLVDLYSDEMFTDGFYLSSDGSILKIPTDDESIAQFYIEKIVYNVTNKTTKFYLIGV